MEQEQLDIVKERIHAFMREDAYRPLKEDELAAGLRGVGEELVAGQGLGIVAARTQTPGHVDGANASEGNRQDPVTYVHAPTVPRARARCQT